MDISLVRLKRLKTEYWSIFIPKYPFCLSVQTNKEYRKKRVQTYISVQLQSSNEFLNVIEVKTSQALRLCLLHMKASSFLCHFPQKEPIGFPLKSFYWLVHMVYVFFKRSLVYLGKEWEFNHTPLWAGAGAARTVGSLVTSAQVSEESVLEAQRTHNDIDSIQPLKPAHLKPFQRWQQLRPTLGIKLALNASHDSRRSRSHRRSLLTDCFGSV